MRRTLQEVHVVQQSISKPGVARHAATACMLRKPAEWHEAGAEDGVEAQPERHIFLSHGGFGECQASAKVAEPEVAYEKEGQDLTMAARRLRHAIRCATYIQARYRGRCDRVQEGASRNVWA